MRTFKAIILIFVAALVSCGQTENLYSNFRCYFYFDNSTHNDATLATAMTPYSGTFTTISLSAGKFIFSNNQGLNSVVNMTAQDQQRSMIVGMNNGLIVGYGTSADGTFFAYDRECPNCFNINQIPVRSYKISVSDFGIGSCANCHREYDLNNGGIISKGDPGNKLSRYYATTTGPYGRLTVQ
ncbi:MAG: hypothetical protein LIR46_00700 [Bacteroidota bacterium]|nr:hypothetical protein [Bacteroidota bacterium]